MVSRTDMINVYDVKLKRFTHGYLSLPRTGAKCLSMGYISVCGGGIADGGTVDKGVQWQKEGQRYVVVYTGCSLCKVLFFDDVLFFLKYSSTAIGRDFHLQKSDRYYDAVRMDGGRIGNVGIESVCCCF